MAEIEAITRTDNAVAVTTQQPHGITTGDVAAVSAVSYSGPTAFNGSFTVTSSPNVSQFAYDQVGEDANGTGGNVDKVAVRPLSAPQITAAEARAAHEGYLHRVLVAFDQFWNVVAGGFPDETISAHAGRDARKNLLLAKFITQFLDIIQPQHGELAEAGDAVRAERVEDLENASLGVRTE